MSQFVIRDWANNLCFNGKTFDSFEDGWAFLHDKFPNGDDDGTFDDYFVMNVKEQIRRARRMTCCICLAYTVGRQWWNRDDGYGICNRCADSEEKRHKDDPQEMIRCYGKKFVNYYLEGKNEI